MLNEKGLSVCIYKNADPAFGDCTLNGISKNAHTAFLLGCEGWMTVEDNLKHHKYPILRIEMYLDKYIRAIPVDRDGMWAFGGNFVYSCDSRFSKLNKGFPIPIHDRDMRLERR